MTVKDIYWLFFILTAGAINSSAVLANKNRPTESWILLSAAFFLLFTCLIFYFKSRRSGFSLSFLKKILIFLVFFSILNLFLFFFIPNKPKINKEKAEAEIQKLIAEQQILAKEIEALKNENKIEETIKKIPEIKQKLSLILALNEELISLNEKQEKEKYLQRKQMLENHFLVMEKIESCLPFYPEDKQKFNDCQKQADEMIKKIDRQE